MNKIIAIQSDDIKKINIKTDTSVFLAKEAQARGYKIIWYETKDLNFINSKCSKVPLCCSQSWF